ncbi:uncharacterized protein LOC136075342 [Hydra vulgaris]|uniref:Uncharacterized protein LOC136075342 n=1 Tax=Hydra vulgaris TaxID=6087 RepID=A0ABM4B5X6_HYDVU
MRNCISFQLVREYIKGRGVPHTCCKSNAVSNIIDISESLGEKNAEQIVSGLLKHKMERENIVSGEQFMLSTGGLLLLVTVGVNKIKSKRKKVNQISFQTIMELANELELFKNKTKKLCSTLRRNVIGVVESSINIKMTELEETLYSLYECKTEELVDGNQTVFRDIVYVKNTTEFIKFTTEKRGIDNLNAMVRISIDGGQNFLKVIINVFDPKNHYSSSEIYEDSGVKRCYILAIVELVSEDNGNLQKLLAPLKLEEVNFSLAFDLKCANSIFRLSGHSGKYACLYCEGECSLETGKLRTLGSIDLCYDQ